MESSLNDSRNIIFISKATPGDDAFAMWISPRLEAAGYKVFADILNLDTGDGWRRKLTKTLQNNTIKMLLCCSDETLDRHGVQEEIGIAEDLSRELNDPNFILPLKLKPFKKVFGMGGLQYIDFDKSWADGLQTLLNSLDKQNVTKSSDGIIQPQWEQYRKRNQIVIENSPETLTSNWLRLISAPDVISYIEPQNPFNHEKLLKLGRSFEYPLIPFRRGFLTFCLPFDMEEHFSAIGPFETKHNFDLQSFLESGSEYPQIGERDAKNKITDLLRQAWEKFCVREGYLAHEYSNGIAFHVGQNKLDIGKRVPWGRQGQRRNSMLRNIAKGRVWEYGVSVIL